MEKLFNGIHLLRNGKYTLPYCNCLLIEDEINCLVDSGFPDSETIHLQGKPIDIIVNTHGHSDHCSRNYQFPEARVLMHPGDNRLVESGEQYLDELGFYKFNEQEYRPFYLDGVAYHPRPADEELHDGQMLGTGRIQFQVVHLPGHSQGHCGFWFPESGMVFTGDILLDPFDTMFFNLNSNVQDFIDSIERLRQLNPEMLVRGHGRGVVTRDIPKRLAAYRDRFDLQSEKVLQAVGRGKNSIAALASEQIVLGNFQEPRSVFFLHEQVMVWKHLQRLTGLGQVVEDRGLYCLAEGVKASRVS